MKCVACPRHPIRQDDVIIDNITPGSINVEWHVEVPATVMTEVASLVATMADAPAISVSIGGATVAATEVAAPVVYTEPDVVRIRTGCFVRFLNENDHLPIQARDKYREKLKNGPVS